MRDENLRRAVLILLAAIMVIGVSAYGTASAPSAEDGPLTPYDEPITLTWGVRTISQMQFFGGDTYESNVWTRKIKEDLNIDVEVMFSADALTYNDKMSAVLASGNLPDMMVSDDRNFISQAYNAGYLADITDVYEQYVSDDVRALCETYPGGFAGATFDGRLHGFPTMNDNFPMSAYLWIRDDWLENTNSHPPKTVDEMIELARKFTFDNPNNDETNTYGFRFTKYVTDTLPGLLSAYGVPAMGRDGGFYRGKDGKITNPYIQPEVKICLEIFRDMYNEGIIDPEFIVKGGSDLESEWANGQLGMTYGRNWDTWYPYNFLYQNKGVTAHPYAIPKAEGYDYKLWVSNNAGGQLFMLNSKFEHPEAMIKILNLNYKMCFGSTEEDYQTYWANEQYRLCPINIMISPELSAPWVLPALEKGSDADVPTAMKPYYNYVIDFESGKNTDANAYGTWGQLSKNGSMAIALNEYVPDGAQVEDLLGAEIPDVWLENRDILRNLIDTTFAEIVIGEKDISYFDVFVQDWLNNGGQQTLDALEAIYAK